MEEPEGREAGLETEGGEVFTPRQSSPSGFPEKRREWHPAPSPSRIRCCAPHPTPSVYDLPPQKRAFFFKID